MCILGRKEISRSNSVSPSKSNSSGSQCTSLGVGVPSCSSSYDCLKSRPVASLDDEGLYDIGMLFSVILYVAQSTPSGVNHIKWYIHICRM